MPETAGHETKLASHLSSGEILIHDVVCDDSDDPVARSGEIVDTQIIESLKSKGVTRVRIRAVVTDKPGTDAHLKARKQIEAIVRQALTEIAPRFRHCDLKDIHVKTLLHACALRRAKQIVTEKTQK